MAVVISKKRMLEVDKRLHELSSYIHEVKFLIESIRFGRLGKDQVIIDSPFYHYEQRHQMQALINEICDLLKIK